jgi:hypothetical protein
MAINEMIKTSRNYGDKPTYELTGSAHGYKGAKLMATRSSSNTCAYLRIEESGERVEWIGFEREDLLGVAKWLIEIAKEIDSEHG